MLAWLLSAATGKRNRWPGEGCLWATNLAVGFLFGTLHLPATTLVVDLTGPVVAHTLALSLLPSLLFGWLYWRQGLLAAMVAHLSADVVLFTGARLLA